MDSLVHLPIFSITARRLVSLVILQTLESIIIIQKCIFTPIIVTMSPTRRRKHITSYMKLNIYLGFICYAHGYWPPGARLVLNVVPDKSMAGE